MAKRDFDFPLCLGRLLTRQKKHPNLGRLLNKQRSKGDTSIQAILRQTSLDVNPDAAEFFLSLGIQRIELDNVTQGSDVSLRISRTLYFPYIPVTMTRFCRIAAEEAGQQNLYRKNPCSHKCLGTLREFAIDDLRLYLMGTVQFYLNNVLPKELDAFERLVFEAF